MKPYLPLLYDCILPTGPLPNGLINEFSILNFIHSFHATTTDNGNILEKEFGNFDNTFLGLMFNNNYGQFPNSLTSTHFTNPCYSAYYTMYENSIYHGKPVCENRSMGFSKYLYVIKVSPHLDKFIGTPSLGSKLGGEYFWKHISSIAMNDILRNKAIIILDYAEENFIDKTEFESLHSALLGSNLTKDQVILAFNSFNAEQIYDQWFTKDEQLLTVKNWPFVLTNTSHHYCNNPEQRISFNEFVSSKHVIRPYKFLYKIRRPRQHRLAFLAMLANEGLLEHSDWSCLTSVRLNENEINSIGYEYNIDLDHEKIQNALNVTPKNLESESGAHYANVSAWTDSHPNAYRNSYFYVCTETFTHEPYKSLTEKVFKPIVNFQPFLFIAYPGALQVLRDLGFKTFSGFIDESYDTVTDKPQRLKMILNEVKRLSNMSQQEIHNWYWSMEEILTHNNKHLLNVWKNNPKCLEFINYLLERVK
jgi:hypothetical protein